jgi:citrate lyase subunit beta / citryl-CoA lyase
MSHSNRDSSVNVRRSELVCPAHSLKMMAKAAAGSADEVIFDLEDGCAISQKVPARKTLIDALQTLNFGDKIRAFRANGIHTRFFYRDIIEVVEAAGAKIDVLVLPKVRDAADVLFADRLLAQIEQNMNWPVGRIRLEALIESAIALVNVEAIATATPRLASLLFGVVDYAGDIGIREPLREQFTLYHYPKARIIAAARAAGIDVIDGVTTQVRDLELCEHDAREAARMGFDGKWAIHPDQVEIINRAFTPTQEELARAREILDAYDQADQNSGAGVFVYQDEMIDAASLPIERKKLAIARKCGLV